MAVNVNKLSIFLSYSNKDQEKVRKIRNILETLNCEPIMFFLKCLDDNNDQLEEFIKAEIEARNLFVYCKSSNSENSVWVQKELEYIKKFDKNRLYTLEIEKDLSFSLVGLLSMIASMLKRNRVFFSYSRQDNSTARIIKESLIKQNYQVLSDCDVSFSSLWGEQIKERINEGIFIALLPSGGNSSVFIELGYALNSNSSVILLATDDSKIPLFDQKRNRILSVSKVPTETEIEKILEEIKNIPNCMI